LSSPRPQPGRLSESCGGGDAEPSPGELSVGAGVLGVEAGVVDDDGCASDSVEGCDTAATGGVGGNGCCAGGWLAGGGGFTGLGLGFGLGCGDVGFVGVLTEGVATSVCVCAGVCGW
jgi:hypothetical protein